MIDLKNLSKEMYYCLHTTIVIIQKIKYYSICIVYCINKIHLSKSYKIVLIEN